MQDKLEIARAVAEKIEGIEGVRCAYVDDYNKFGSFQVVAILDLDNNRIPTKQNFSIRNINKEVKKILKETTGVSQVGSDIDSPSRMYYKYTYRNVTDSTFIGYEKSYTMIDFVVVLPQEQISIAELLI
jgi:hypothetical protein